MTDKWSLDDINQLAELLVDKMLQAIRPELHKLRDDFGARTLALEMRVIELEKEVAELKGKNQWVGAKWAAVVAAGTFALTMIFEHVNWKAIFGG